MDTAAQESISRRRLAKGAAWSVPAVAVLVASPAYAASIACPTLTGVVLNRPSNDSATVTLTLTGFVSGTTYSVLLDFPTGNSGDFNGTSPASANPVVFTTSGTRDVVLTRANSASGTFNPILGYTVTINGTQKCPRKTFTFTYIR